MPPHVCCVGSKLVIHKSRKSRLILDFSSDEAQAVTVLVEHCALTCLYRPPSGMRLPLCHFVEESRHLLPPNAAWIGMGDFNDVPKDAILCTSHEGADSVVKTATDASGNLLPTR